MPGLYPFQRIGRNGHGIISRTAQGSFGHGPWPLTPMCGLWCHSIHFKRGETLLKSDQLLCPDNLMVTVQDGLTTVFYLPYLGFQPKAAPHNVKGGLYPLPESHLCCSDNQLLHV